VTVPFTSIKNKDDIEDMKIKNDALIVEYHYKLIDTIHEFESHKVNSLTYNEYYSNITDKLIIKS